MSEARHTAGPWAVNEDGFKVESENEHGWVNDGWVVCVTEGPDKKSNARLIAAAPDLLGALKALRDESMGFVPQCAEQVDAAIAKAEGK